MLDSSLCNDSRSRKLDMSASRVWDFCCVLFKPARYSCSALAVGDLMKQSHLSAHNLTGKENSISVSRDAPNTGVGLLQCGVQV